LKNLELKNFFYLKKVSTRSYHPRAEYGRLYSKIYPY
jgi:hypothetical protein